MRRHLNYTRCWCQDDGMMSRDRLITEMNHAVRMFDWNRAVEPSGPELDVKSNLVALLNELFRNWLDFSEAGQDRVRQVFLKFLGVAFHEHSNSSELVEEASEIFRKKNTSRGSACWIKSGVLGQALEIQAKVERILNSSVEEESDSVKDAWVDLVNYCRFGVVCCDFKRHAPVYGGDLIIGDPANGVNW